MITFAIYKMMITRIAKSLTERLYYKNVVVITQKQMKAQHHPFKIRINLMN